MKNLKFCFLFSSLLLFRCLTLAQTGTSHEQIRSTLKDPHVAAASVDALLPQLQAIEKKEVVNSDSQQVALDIFLQAAYAYARNFHFKQGMLVYQGYLDMKDKYAFMNKSKSVQALLSQNKQQKEKLNSELSQKKNSAEQLQLDIESWKKTNGKFSRNYSLVVILITAVLALIFIRINMNTVRAKNNLRDNRDKMQQMQRVAMLGHFHEGSLTFLKSSPKILLEKAKELTVFTKEQYPGEQNPIGNAASELMKQVEQSQQKLESLLP